MSILKGESRVEGWRRRHGRNRSARKRQMARTSSFAVRRSKRGK